MILQELRKLKTGRRDLRKFGLLVGGVFALLALWCWWRGKPAFPYLAGVAVPLVLLGLAWPGSLKWIYLGWMSLGLSLGLVVSTILLTVFYYVAVTPLALIARAAGKDFLTRRLDRKATSYWIVRGHSASKPRRSYEQQF
jgi:hypothetical protein